MSLLRFLHSFHPWYRALSNNVIKCFCHFLSVGLRPMCLGLHPAFEKHPNSSRDKAHRMGACVSPELGLAAWKSGLLCFLIWCLSAGCMRKMVLWQFKNQDGKRTEQTRIQIAIYCFSNQQCWEWLFQNALIRGCRIFCIYSLWHVQTDRKLPMGLLAHSVPMFFWAFAPFRIIVFLFWVAGSVQGVLSILPVSLFRDLRGLEAFFIHSGVLESPDGFNRLLVANL